MPDQAAAWFPDEEEAAFQMLGRWCGALGYILVAHLTGSPGLDPKVEVCCTYLLVQPCTSCTTQLPLSGPFLCLIAMCVKVSIDGAANRTDMGLCRTSCKWRSCRCWLAGSIGPTVQDR